ESVRRYGQKLTLMDADTQTRLAPRGEAGMIEWREHAARRATAFGRFTLFVGELRATHARDLGPLRLEGRAGARRREAPPGHDRQPHSYRNRADRNSTQTSRIRAKPEKTRVRWRARRLRCGSA